MNQAPAAARIGPNAIIQMAGALESRIGAAPVRVLFATAGLDAYIDAPPSGMVDEREVVALHSACRAQLAPALMQSAAAAAGLATGDYLLAHRIPRPARALLEVLPAALAARLLIRAIERHAWTFAGSGRFSARAGRPVVLTIGDCAICRGAASGAPVCGYYAATFERLFARLVHPRARAVETRCIAAGAEACRFEIDWR